MDSALLGMIARAALKIGEKVFDLIAAMDGGDVHTVDALSHELDEPDRIRARAEALKARQLRKAADAAKSDGGS